MKSKTLWILIFLWMVCLIKTAVAAQEIYIPQIQNSIYVYDEAYFISSNMEEELNERLRNLDWNSEIQFFIVTIEDSGEMSLGEYAYRLFVEMGIGDNAVIGGILIVAADTQDEPILVAGKKVKNVLYSEIRQKIIDNRYMIITNESNTTMAIETTVNEVLSILSENSGQLRTFVTRATLMQIGIYALIAVGIIVCITIMGMFIYGLYIGDFELLIISLHFVFELVKLIISIVFLFNFLRGVSLKGIRDVFHSGQEKIQTIRTGGGKMGRGSSVKKF